MCVRVHGFACGTIFVQMWELFSGLAGFKCREPGLAAFQIPAACSHRLFAISCAHVCASMCARVQGEEEEEEEGGGIHRKFEEEKEEEALGEGIPFVWICVPDYISSIFAALLR